MQLRETMNSPSCKHLAPLEGGRKTIEKETLHVSTIFVSAHEFGEKCKVDLQSQVMVCCIWTAIIKQ